jgi:histidinol-phosphate aminotransferase
VLQTLLLTYGGPGRRALMFEPTYALHAHICRLTGTEVIQGPRRDDFGIDVDAARALVAQERPEIVFLCSPNNPTGTVDPPATVAAITDVAPGLVIVDEAYGEFARDSALALVDDDRAVVVTRTYSKVWSLAALRLGFCVAPPWIVEELEKVVLPYHLDVSTQLAGTTALRFRSEMEARVAFLVEDRERLFRALDELDGVTVFPSGANFLLFRIDAGPGGNDRGHAVWEALVERGVLVRDFSRWPGVEDCLRVTVGTTAENDAFLSALRDVLREHGAR